MGGHRSRSRGRNTKGLAVARVAEVTNQMSSARPFRACWSQESGVRLIRGDGFWRARQVCQTGVRIRKDPTATKNLRRIDKEDDLGCAALHCEVGGWSGKRRVLGQVTNGSWAAPGPRAEEKRNWRGIEFE